MTHRLKIAAVLFLALTFVWLPQKADAGAVSPGASLVSLLQTEPELTTGEAVEVSIWLLDAAGNLQTNANQPVYIWLEAQGQPGIMSPVLREGERFVAWEIQGGVLSAEPLHIFRAGRYTLYASLTEPTPDAVARRGISTLATGQVHPIVVKAGAPMPAWENLHIQMTAGTPLSPLQVPIGGEGLALTLCLQGYGGRPLAPVKEVTVTPRQGNVAVRPETLQTDSQGCVTLQLQGLSRGADQLDIAVGGMARTLPLQVGAKQIVYYINQANAVVDNRHIQLDTATVIQNNRTYVPYRSLAEAFGGEVSYDSGVITTVLGDRTVVMAVGNPAYTVNGAPGQMDAAPFIDPAAGRTLIPVRFAAEGLGLQVTPVYSDRGATESVQIHQ